MGALTSAGPDTPSSREESTMSAGGIVMATLPPETMSKDPLCPSTIVKSDPVMRHE